MSKTQAKKNQQPHAKGQSLVEMTLVLPILLILLAGAVDAGMAFFSFVAVREASQEAAAYASICPVTSSGSANTTAIIARARNSSDNPVDLLDTTNVLVSVTFSPSSPAAGGSVTVTVTYNYSTIMPLFETFWGTNVIPLKATTTNTILSGVACP